MLRHILLIRFKSTVTHADIANVRRLFAEVASLIPGIAQVEWGKNNSPEGLNADFEYCVTMSFVDEAARDHYLPHPAHLALVEQFKPTLESIVVFDYAVETP